MATNPFDRLVINPRERPLSSDINQAESVLDRSMRQVMDSLFLARTSNTSSASNPSGPISGFIGDAFKVDRVTDTEVSLRAGLGFLVDTSAQTANISGISGLDDLARYKPVYLSTAQTISGIPAAPVSPQTRFDIVEVRMNRVLGDASSRDVLDPSTGVFAPGSVFKSLGFALDGNVGIVTSPSDSTAAISYKVGVAGSPGAVPAATPGYTIIAVIKRDAAASPTLAVGDWRKYLVPYGMGRVNLVVNAPDQASGPPFAAPTLVSCDSPPGVDVQVSGFGNAGDSYFGHSIVLGVRAGTLTNVQCQVTACGYAPTQNYRFAVPYGVPVYGVANGYDPVVVAAFTTVGSAPAASSGVGGIELGQRWLAQSTGNVIYSITLDLSWR